MSVHSDSHLVFTCKNLDPPLTLYLGLSAHCYGPDDMSPKKGTRRVLEHTSLLPLSLSLWLLPLLLLSAKVDSVLVL